ncbi:MAG TPA: hypothetical protein QF601_02015 [Dehalococcoidia bacterium]|nr:hypothetical protein [Dehalococcoidia bacterium]
MVLNNDSSFLAKKIIYREFQNQDQTQIESLVSTGLRNTAINQDIYIRERIEKWALKHNFKEIILGTSEIQKDATRFWVDSGFKLIKK